MMFFRAIRIQSCCDNIHWIRFNGIFKILLSVDFLSQLKISLALNQHAVHIRFPRVIALVSAFSSSFFSWSRTSETIVSRVLHGSFNWAEWLGVETRTASAAGDVARRCRAAWMDTTVLWQREHEYTSARCTLTLRALKYSYSTQTTDLTAIKSGGLSSRRKNKSTCIWTRKVGNGGREMSHAKEISHH